jgi:hypothetical protein
MVKSELLTDTAVELALDTSVATHIAFAVTGMLLQVEPIAQLPLFAVAARVVVAKVLVAETVNLPGMTTVPLAGTVVLAVKVSVSAVALSMNAPFCKEISLVAAPVMLIPVVIAPSREMPVTALFII